MPYLIISTFFYFPSRLLTGVINNSNINALEWYVNNCLLATNIDHLWFLISLFEIFIISIFTKSIITKYPIGYFLFSYILFILARKASWVLQLTNTFSFLIYFFLGCMLAQHREKVLKYITTKILFITFILSIILFMMNYNLQYPYVISRLRIFEFLAAVNGSIMMYILSYLIFKRLKRIPQFLLSFSSNTFGVYLFHNIILFYFLYFIQNTIVNPWYMGIIMFLSAITISYILTNIIRRLRFQFIIGE